jgi:putative restriction endonuclease
LVNPQRGIFKPRQMAGLLSIRTVFPRQGGRIWYDDQRDAHRQIYAGDDTVEYAFMGTDPGSPDNRWLREAMEQQTQIIYFLGTSPGRYQPIRPTFIVGWHPGRLRVALAFGAIVSASAEAAPPTALERRYALREVKGGCIRRRSGRPCWLPTAAVARSPGYLKHDSWTRHTSSSMPTSSWGSQSCRMAYR